jgi:hypothetical protein
MKDLSSKPELKITQCMMEVKDLTGFKTDKRAQGVISMLRFSLIRKFLTNW